MSESSYQEYSKDYSKMENRLEYLKHYNTLDTQIMIPIIEGLSKMFASNDIDMLRNLSLSSNSNQAKYGLAYKDFNMNEDYSLNQKQHSN
jgi:hypothetical protein